MKKNKILLIILGIVFFLGSLTFYLNRVVFPVALQKIVVSHAESFLKRKVEIGSLHFNWVKGFVADKVKVYQKESDQSFVQAERLSFGLIFIPGFKQHRVTIPFITIEGPSAHLVRSGGTWNFSDLLNASPAKSEDKPSPFNVTVAGIHIIDGKIRLDDVSGSGTWTELFDNINLNAGLSYKGIAFDLYADIPKKQGLISAHGAYQFLTGDLQSQVQIKNIRPSEYLAFLPVSTGVEFKNGLVQDVDVDVHYSKNAIQLKGDAILKNLNIVFNGVAAAADNLEAKIRRLDLSKGSLAIEANVSAGNAAITLSPQRVIKAKAASLENIKARNDKEGLQLVGMASAQGLDLLWDGQKATGDLLAKPMTVQVKGGNDMTANGDLRFNHLSLAAGDRSLKGNATVEDIVLHINKQMDVDFNGRVSLDDVDARMADAKANGSIELTALNFKLADNTISVKTKGELNNWQAAVDNKTVVAEASFTADVVYPLDRKSTRLNSSH